MELAFHFYVPMLYPLPDLHLAITVPEILRRWIPFAMEFISALLGFNDNFLILSFLYRSSGSEFIRIRSLWLYRRFF